MFFLVSFIVILLVKLKTDYLIKFNFCNCYLRFVRTCDVRQLLCVAHFLFAWEWFYCMGGIAMARERFKHLSFTDRLKIEAGLKMKMSVKQIAESIGVHISTVYREIKRGVYLKKESRWDHYGYEKYYRYKETYSPDIAEQKYRAFLQAKGAPLKIGKDHALAEYLEHKIVDEGWTVSAALGEIKRKQMPFSTSICVRTLCC